MALPEPFIHPESIVSYVMNSGGRTTNHDLVREFRDPLRHPQFGEDNKKILRDVTGKIGVVKKMEGEKFIEFKPKLQGLSVEEIFEAVPALRKIVQRCVTVEQNNDNKEKSLFEETMSIIDERSKRGSIYLPSKESEVENFLEPKPQEEPPEIEEIEEDTSITSINTDATPIDTEMPITKVEEDNKTSMEKENLNPSSPISPPPPPIPLRRSASQMEMPPPMLPPKKTLMLTRSFSVESHLAEEEKEEARDTFNENPEFTLRRDPFKKRRRQSAIHKTSVKDLTQSFNQFADSSQLQLSDHVKKRPQHAQHPPLSRRKSVVIKPEESSTKLDITPMGPKGKEWVLAASKGDVGKVRQILLENQTMAQTCDNWNHYTALHWAAKHGNLRLARLLVEQHGADVDVRSRGGYTPLMLAAMYNRTDVYFYLVQSGKCKVELRDYSGRKAEHYLEESARVRESMDEEEKAEPETMMDIPDEEDEEDNGNTSRENTLSRRKRMTRTADQGSSFLRNLVRDSVHRASSRYKVHGVDDVDYV